MACKFEQREMWELTPEHVNCIYGIAEKLPSLEAYNLKSQIIHVGTAIAINTWLVKEKDISRVKLSFLSV